MLRSGRCSARICGTPAYAPPEQLTGYSPDGLSGQRRLSAESDVWSLGATRKPLPAPDALAPAIADTALRLVAVFQMLTGQPPFWGDSFDALVNNAIGLHYCRRLPPDVPAAASQVLDSMLQVAAIDRASVEELLRSNWLREVGYVPPPPEPGVLEVGITCEPCDALEGGAVGLHEPLGSRRLQGLKRSALRLLYVGLCAAAVMTHVSSRNSGSDHGELPTV